MWTPNSLFEFKLTKPNIPNIHVIAGPYAYTVVQRDNCGRAAIPFYEACNELVFYTAHKTAMSKNVDYFDFRIVGWSS